MDVPLAHGLATVELMGGARPDAFTPVRGVINVPEDAGWGLA